MADATDMSTPVTRGELREDLAQLRQELDQKLAPLATRAELEEKLAPLATRAELEDKLAPLATRAELEDKLAPLATRAELAPLATRAELELWGGALLKRIEASERKLIGLLTRSIEASEQRLHAELARHTNAIHESITTLISIVEEKYADLPPRVGRLEAKVFAPRRR